MNSRYYPVKESEFNLKILPLIVSYKNRSGRPPKSSNYNAFCGILYILRTGFHGEICHHVLAIGIQFICALSAGVTVVFFGIL